MRFVRVTIVPLTPYTMINIALVLQIIVNNINSRMLIKMLYTGLVILF